MERASVGLMMGTIWMEQAVRSALWGARHAPMIHSAIHVKETNFLMFFQNRAPVGQTAAFTLMVGVLVKNVGVTTAVGLVASAAVRAKQSK